MSLRQTLRAHTKFAIVPVWVLERCSSRAVHVYALLMKYANAKTRRAWPKTETLAVQLGMSHRTVERAIAELRAAHAIQTRRHHGRNGAVLGLEFVLIQADPTADLTVIEGGADPDIHPATSGGNAADNLPATSGGKDEGREARPASRRESRENRPKNAPGEAVPPIDAGPMDLPATSGGKAPSHPATGVAAIPPPVAAYKRELDPGNQIQEQQLLPEGSVGAIETPEPGQVFTGGPVLDPTDPCDALALAWNASICDPLTPVQSLTPTRRRHIRAALAARSIDTWRDLFRRVMRSSFCRGEGRSAFRATFDWLIGSPDAVAKLTEGQYDDHFSAAELEAAAAYRFKITCSARTCIHTPVCAFDEDCLERIALLLRTRKVAS